ncbi:MAG: phosphatase PAP2 family protein [Oscillatoriales cyanobacterium]|nr:MAG: phosphatase PAP2 family protein [Oscillatoriales cyanobacterium]
MGFGVGGDRSSGLYCVGVAESAHRLARLGSPTAAPPPQHGPPTLDQCALWLTGWGTRWGTLPIAAIGALFWTGQRQWRKLAYWVGTIGGTALVAAILRELWQRPRPKLWSSLLPPDRYPTDWSFPSGHATASLSLVAALWVLCPVVIPPRLRGATTWAISLLGGSFVIAIAWTRLYLGLHFLTDTMGG